MAGNAHASDADATTPHGRRLGPALVWLVMAVALALGIRAPAAAAGTSASCSVATGKITYPLCWLNFAGDTVANGASQSFTFALPDGSTLSLTATNNGPNAAAVTALPTYGGAALDNTAYTGINNADGFYSSGNASETLSAIALTNAAGTSMPNVGIAGADDESLDTGDGSSASMTWTTAGTAWSQLQILPNTSGSTTAVCSMSGIGSTTATCKAANSGNQAAYVLATTVTSSQNVTMSDVTSSKQGFTFAVEMASVTVAKTVTGREASSDEFNVVVSKPGGAATTATATTSGSATGTTTSPTAVVVPNQAYTWSETATSGTLSQYVATYACANATAGSTTAMPSGTGTSVSITPAPTDQITCTFTNAPLSLTVASANGNQSGLATSTVQTDPFTLTNASGVAGIFQVSGTGEGATIAAASGTAPSVGAYLFGGKSYATLSALQSAITSAGATAAGASIQISVQYTTSAAATTDTVTLVAAIASGSSTSPTASGAEQDAISGAQLAISKTGTTQAAPGGPIFYSVVVTNNATVTASGATLSDPFPSGVTLVGSPSCAASGSGTSCGTLSSTSTSVSIKGASIVASGSLTVTFTGSASAAGSYTNTATANLTNGVATTSSLATTVAASNGLSKTVRDVTTGDAASSADAGSPGDTLEYALAFPNTTGAALSNVVVSDATPANTTFVSATCGTLPSGITGCTVSAPAVGATGSVTYKFAGTLGSGTSVGGTLRVKIN